MRPEGISVVTDFGDDLPSLLNPFGFATTIHLLPNTRPVLRVLESIAI
jgi:hypothetical protein